MGSVSLDADAQIQKLHAYIDDKQQMNAEDLSSFFNKARKALRTHQDVLDFEPDAAAASRAKAAAVRLPGHARHKSQTPAG
jgi:hypothetical protein